MTGDLPTCHIYPPEDRHRSYCGVYRPDREPAPEHYHLCETCEAASAASGNGLHVLTPDGPKILRRPA